MSAISSEPIGVIVSTYNKPRELSLVLEGWRNQTDARFELYIADDGSKTETAELITRTARYFPVPLHHIWQEDAGFRLSRIRNLAIQAAHHPYLVITDGDCIPLPGMLAAHRRFATQGCFLNGERLLLSQTLSAGLLSHPWPVASESTLSLLRRRLTGQLNRTLPLLLPPLATKPTQRMKGLRGCHLSFWRDDLIRTNGFDENYQGWGREDSDMAARLFHAGIWRRNLRGIPLLHLWHPEEDRRAVSRNDLLLRECMEQKRVRALQGIGELEEEAT